MTDDPDEAAFEAALEAAEKFMQETTEELLALMDKSINDAVSGTAAVKALMRESGMDEREISRRLEGTLKEMVRLRNQAAEGTPMPMRIAPEDRPPE